MSAPQRYGSSSGSMGAVDVYLPGVIACAKTLLYTSIVPLFLYGGILHTVLVGFLIAALYYDNAYFNPPVSYLDTTAVALDVTGGQILALARMPMYRRCGGYGCISALVLWVLLGIAHIAVGEWIPVMVAHAATVGLFTAQCAFVSPNFGWEAISEDVPAAYLRAVLYLSLVLLEAYVQRREFDRTYMLRYGSVLMAPWMIACAFAVLLAAVQCGQLYYKSHPAACPTAAAASAAISVVVAQQQPTLLTPAQLSRPPTVSNATAPLDLQEAFRMAKAAYALNNNGGKQA